MLMLQSFAWFSNRELMPDADFTSDPMDVVEDEEEYEEEEEDDSEDEDFVDDESDDESDEDDEEDDEEPEGDDILEFLTSSKRL